jgi:hypothetical protein
MTTRTLKATMPCSAAELIERLGDDLAFPAHAPDIISVADAGDGLRRWVIAFRGGTAQWVQRDRGPESDAAGAPPSRAPGQAERRTAPRTHGRPPVDPGSRRHRIEFEQVDGDFQRLSGSWTSGDLPEGCEVTFEVNFSTNVPHLSGAIDSAVGRVLLRSAHQILHAIGGPVQVTAGGHHLWDLPGILDTERTPADAVR